MRRTDHERMMQYLTDPLVMRSLQQCKLTAAPGFPEMVPPLTSSYEYRKEFRELKQQSMEISRWLETQKITSWLPMRLKAVLRFFF